MTKLILATIFALTAISLQAQTAKPTPSSIPAGVPVKPGTKTTAMKSKAELDPGILSGQIYTHVDLGFDITFPATWVIPGIDTEKYWKEKGYELRPKINRNDPQQAANIRRYEKQVTLLLTAYRSAIGTPGNAVLLISAEDLSTNPKIKDAVDYFDLMRAQIGTMKLPPDYEYSVTNAERLGAQQFAFLDITAAKEKKRLYATVRDGYAIILAFTYHETEDLAAFRRILEEANFSLRTQNK
ncbi:MAG: hypothetical protein KA956_01380 [Pyrinomonadaceae bacterium]|nr:hypothetical protein [Acidobacteriota bacterium]MBP7375105.1 hypothetical protein [Pyrinomonadaceae bacterium]